MDTLFHSLANNYQLKPIQQSLNKKQEQTKCISGAQVLSDKVNMRCSLCYEMKSVFYKYSRIHYHYKLKFSTLFHASSLFAKCMDSLQAKGQTMSFEYLSLVCLYLSMKFQQIYPPRLKTLHIYFKKLSIQPSNYREYQKKVLELLNGDLSVNTGKEILDGYLKQQEKEKYFYAYYLLQIALLDHTALGYSIQEICQAIVLIMSQNNLQANKILKLSEKNMEAVNKCARAIATAKIRLKANEIQLIQRKYAKQQYCCVAGRQIWLQFK